jgi:Lecithin:cholesterol acyltransferase
MEVAMASPMSDVIVVVPGIMGSTLLGPAGDELWGVHPGTLLRSIRRLGSNFEKLRLPPGIGDNPAPDGVRAGDLIPIPHVVGKLLGSDGYGHLIAWLENTFTVRQPKEGTAGNLIPFPYDWRLSNRFTARRMEAELVPHLEQWRKESNNPEAKFRFLCHSMGGLAARWFTEVLGGRELTRQLITIGTPHRGAAAALLKISNGFDLKLGPVGLPLTEILRSLPSAHQLLPTYRCIETADGLKRISDVAIPDVDDTMLSDALAFHSSILEQVEAQEPKGYETFALKGIAQPTVTSARFRNGRLEPLNTLDGKDWFGDGTVPRISSHMPEWRNDATAAVFGQQHSTLQSDGNLHRQLYAILTASELETYADAEKLFGLDLPEVVEAGEPLAITVTSPGGDASLPLRAELFGEDGSEIDSRLMRNLGEGRYQAQFEDIPPGQVKVRIANATADVPLDPVTGVTLVWDSALDKDDA